MHERDLSLQKPPFIYAQKVERVLYEATLAWEGTEVQAIPLGSGEAILCIQSVSAVDIPCRIDTAWTFCFPARHTVEIPSAWKYSTPLGTHVLAWQETCSFGNQ